MNTLKKSRNSEPANTQRTGASERSGADKGFPYQAELNEKLNDPEIIANLLRENQKLISIGRLAASIAHEINNPLESVTNLLFLIGQEGRLPADIQNYLSLAQRELDRVVQISKQTLNFYREASTPALVHVEDLLEEVLVLYRNRIAEKRLNLRRQYSSTQTVEVFPGEMRQVLSNLVVNAIEAVPEGGTLWLRLRSARRWSDGNRPGLRITIADNGSGIPSKTRKRLGTPFLTTKGEHGTGLGLWVAMSIIHRNRGSLRVYSSTRPTLHGTAFTIFLPTNMRPMAVVRRASAPDATDEDESSLETAC